jgi:non-specific riboncleoside hydrolase
MMKIIIDTDPGIDDAVALAVAFFRKDLDISLITTVAGNVSLAKTTKNALSLLEFFHRDIPVAAGACRPLLREPINCSDVHGDTGMDGYEFGPVRTEPVPVHAVEAMKNILLESEEPVTLVTIAPLTNLALLFSLYPDCKKKISRIVAMGGSASRGNTTPAAEFNILADPESAKIVFNSKVPIVMCGLDVTRKAVLLKEDVERIAGMGSTGEMLVSLFKNYRSGGMNAGLKMHDVCAIACLTTPELFQIEDTFIDVETIGTYTAGYTVVDLDHKLNKPFNAKFCTDIKVPQFRNWLIENLAHTAKLTDQ